MKKSARFAGLAFCSAALVALAACSGGESEEGESVEPATTAAANEAAPANATAAAAPEMPAFASLTGDATKGEKIFIQCKTCHVLEEGQNRVGPSLYNIVGRPAGQVAGFNYTPANKNSGKVWTEETLYDYLENPQRAIPGTKMAFAGLKNPQDRADVIAYLKTPTN